MLSPWLFQTLSLRDDSNGRVVSFETSPWTFFYTVRPYSTCALHLLSSTQRKLFPQCTGTLHSPQANIWIKNTKKKSLQQKNAIWADIRIDLENHSSKSPPLLTFLFYNTSCVSLISFSNIFWNTLLPVSSSYVHPRPITAVNHKGKHCWRKLCRIFAFVSQSDTRIGGCEIRRILGVFLVSLTTDESICRSMFLTGFGWIWVFPHVCLSKWLLLMHWPKHFTFGMRLNFCSICLREKGGWLIIPLSS